MPEIMERKKLKIENTTDDEKSELIRPDLQKKISNAEEKKSIKKMYTKNEKSEPVEAKKKYYSYKELNHHQPV